MLDRIVVIDDDDMLPGIAPIVVMMVVVPAPGGGSGAGIPRPMLTPNPVEPENPRLSRSLFLLTPPARPSPLYPSPPLSHSPRHSSSFIGQAIRCHRGHSACKRALVMPGGASREHGCNPCSFVILDNQGTRLSIIGMNIRELVHATEIRERRASSQRKPGSTRRYSICLKEKKHM